MLKNMKPSRLGFETGTWHRHKDLQLYLLCRETIKKKKNHCHVTST